MTDPAARPPRPRANSREIRVLAWVAGSLAFSVPLASFAVSPKPAEAGGETGPVVVRRVVRVIVRSPSEDGAPTFSAPGASSRTPATSTGGS